MTGLASLSFIPRRSFSALQQPSSDREQHLPVLRKRPAIIVNRELERFRARANSRGRFGAFVREQLAQLLELLVEPIGLLEHFAERSAALLQLLNQTAHLVCELGLRNGADSRCLGIRRPL